MQRSQVDDVKMLRVKPLLLTIVDFKLQVWRYERWLDGALIGPDDITFREACPRSSWPKSLSLGLYPDIEDTLRRGIERCIVQLTYQKQ
jgi:hypothetical protein